MKLKKDWSLAYFLYYMFRISFWIFAINISLQVLILPFIGIKESSSFTMSGVPVVLTVDALSGSPDLEENDISISISENIQSRIFVATQSKNNLWALFYYNMVMIFDWLVILIILYFISKVLKNVAQGSPFSKKNARYLFTVGLLMLLGSLLHMLSIYLPMPLLEGLVLSDGIRVKSIMIKEGNFMIGGFMSLVLGYVFKEGNRMYEEQKLTV
ncbi:MAG: DUF2975 domain-containing protein [Balneola sp.]|nr:MAG: DUF2975 domain-containing protein [Balneola sp.]